MASAPAQSTAAVEAARRFGGNWAVFVAPQADARNAVPEGPLAELRKAYLEASFLRCLAITQDPALRRERLLPEGRRDVAARSGYLAAACLHAIGEDVRARQALRELFVAGLDGSGESVRPDFSALATAERRAVDRLAQATLTIATQPAEAELAIDGAPVPCPRRPCEVRLPVGEHWVVAQALARRRTVVPLRLEHDTSVTVTLDWATSDEASRQTARALAEHRAATDVALLKAVALGMGVKHVLGVAASGDGHRAVLFDGDLGRVLEAKNAASAGDAVTGVLGAWADKGRPPPLWKRPWVWVAATVVVAGAITSAALLSGEGGTRYDLVFP